MTTVYDVPASKMIKEVAKALKQEAAIKPPTWSPFVKTGSSREKGAEDEDWWYTRSASMLRKIYLEGPVGVNALRKAYGGKKNRGFAPEARRKGSGAVIRKIFQQLEKSGLVEKAKGGRIVTAKGASLLDKISHALRRST